MIPTSPSILEVYASVGRLYYFSFCHSATQSIVYVLIDKISHNIYRLLPIVRAQCEQSPYHTRYRCCEDGASSLLSALLISRAILGRTSNSYLVGTATYKIFGDPVFDVKCMTISEF